MTNAFDNLRLCTYLFVADAYEHNKKIFESFLPLIETIIINSGTTDISFLSLQNRVNEIYDLNIPKGTLKLLLDMLEKDGKIRVNKNHILLIGENFNADYFKERDQKEEEILELFLTYKEFLQNKEIQISTEEAKSSICHFVFNHCYDLADFINLSVKPELSEEETNSHVSFLLDFLYDCKINNQRVYSAFIRIYNGALQSTLLNFNPDKLDSIQKIDLAINKVVLDSNFLMRVLDLQAELEGKVAQDTLNLLKQQNVELIVLPKSLDEISSSIKAFLQEIEPYTTYTSEYFRHKSIRTSGLLSAYQRGKTRIKLLELSKVSILKQQLMDQGIKVLEEDFILPSNIDDELNDLIRMKNKFSYGTRQAEHDLSLIYYCRSFRKKDVELFSDAKCWVLTSDNKLTYWNQANCSNIQECMTEAQLANLIWLTTPKDDNVGLANTMVTLATRSLLEPATFYGFINNMNTYKEMIKNSKPAVDNLSLIFACDCLTTSDIERINEEEREIDDLISEKAQKIRSEQEEKDLFANQNIDENAKLKVELRKSKLTEEKHQLALKLSQNRHEKDETEGKIDELRKNRDSTFKINKLRKKAGRILAAILLAILLVLAIAINFLVPNIAIAIDKLNLWLISLNIEVWFFSLIVSICALPIITLLSYLVIIIILGDPKKPRELFKHFKDILLERLINERNLPQEYKSIDLKEKRAEIDKALESFKIEKCKLVEEQQGVQHELIKLNGILTELGAI